METRRGVVAALSGASLSLLGMAADAGRKKKKDNKKGKKSGFPKNASVTGTGPQVSRSFRLAAGTYRARATATATSSTGGLFFADLYNSRGLVDYVFIENPETPGTYQYEELADVPRDDSYYLYVDEAEGSWSISLHQL